MQHDHTLVQRAQKGDANAFEELYNTTYDAVFRFIFRKTEGNRPLTEDIVSEAFFKVLQHIDRFTPKKDTPVIAWIYRIADNELKMYWRKQGKYYFEALENHPELRAEHKEMIDYVVTKENRDLIQKAIQSLSQRDKDVLQDHYFKDFSIRMIAEKNNEKEGAIKTRLHRARKNLQKIILRMKPIDSEVH